MRALCLLTTFALSAPLCAQAFSDSFSYPNGAAIPGWTQQRGTWQVQGGRLSSTAGSTWSYITKDGITATNSVVDGTFYFSTAAAVQFGGLTSRHPGGSADANLLMAKIQNNGGVADFDRVFCYERSGNGSTYADIPGGTIAARCRMITLGNEFRFEVDADMNGLFEQSLAANPITVVTGAGMVGMTAFQTSEMDDFSYFDAVLVPQAGATPRVGTNYDLRLASTTPGSPFIGMLSSGKAGLPIGGGRAIPLTADGILGASIGLAALGLAGVTDANGNATTAIPIPSIPSLIGARLYTSFFTIDPARPLAIGDISNEHGFVIVQ